MAILKAITLDDLLSTEWPEEVFIDGGVLSREEKLILGADSKAGKSTLLGQFLRGLASGTDVLGFRVPKPLKVLYMQAELRECRLKERLKFKGAPLVKSVKDNFLIINTRGNDIVTLDNKDDIKRIDETLDYYKPDVWVIDPFGSFNSSDENSPTEMNKVFRVVDQQIAKHKIGTIIAHHFRKQSSAITTNQNNQVPLIERLRGSSAFRGWPDTILCIEGKQGDHSQLLEFELRNSDEIHKRILYYNKTTKEFDWEDPITYLKKWLQPMNGQCFATSNLIDKMLEDCGDRLSNNRSRAFSMKDALIKTNVLKEKQEGKTKWLTVNLP